MTRTTTAIVAITATAASIVVAGLQSVEAAILVLSPVSGDSGLTSTFSTNGSNVPEVFGRETGGGAGTFSGGVLTLLDNASNLDWRSTTDLDTLTSVKTGDGSIEDYWIQLDIENTIANADFSRVFQADSSTGDLFTLRQEGTTIGDYAWHGGAGQTTFSAGAGSHELTFHYDASEDNFNIFVDGTEVLADQVHLSGADAMFTNLRWGGANGGSEWIIDNLVVSTELGFIPEPGTLALLGVSALVLRGMRRRSEDSISEDAE